MPNDTFYFQERTLNTSDLEVPRNAYQRPLSPSRVQTIVRQFDEHLANEPKVSYRDGHYYVFDGQHTVAARKLRNGGQDLPIKCKVYYDLTDADEALLFAQQFGVSAILTSGAKMRALLYGKDPTALAFLRANESIGIQLDYDMHRGRNRIGCIHTAFNEYKTVGEEIYIEAMSIILEAWNGDPHSLRSEIVQAVIQFVNLYHKEYDRTRLVNRLKIYDPLTIYREGQAMGVNLHGYKKYLFQVYRIYNGSSKKTALPLKF